MFIELDIKTVVLVFFICYNNNGMIEGDIVKKTKIINVSVDITTYDEMLENIKEAIQKKQKTTIMAINPKKIMFARENALLKEALDHATYSIPDGYQIVKKVKELKKRVTGIDLMQKICNKHEEMDAKIFLYGSTKKNVELAKQQLIQQYPNIKIAGVIDGYQKSDIVIKHINESNANIVFVALGSPKQELWMHENKDNIHASVIMGVGGSFDVIAGQVKRAPVLLQKMGLEWLYRFLKQPKKMLEIPIYVKYLKLVRSENKK